MRSGDVASRPRCWSSARLACGSRLGLLAVCAFLLAGCQTAKRLAPVSQLPPPPPPASDGRLLRVILAEAAAEVVLGGAGAWRLDTGCAEPTTYVFAAGETVALRARDGIVLSARFGQQRAVGHLTIAPLEAADCVLWDGRPWRGGLRIEPAASDRSRLAVINLVEMESYLAGVLPVEMGRGRAPSELAALAAQAVAARTYAAAVARRARSQRGFDLYADVRDQVYGGAGVEDSLCSAAIAQTAGLVLRRRAGGELADTFFHSTCGGHTACNAEMWPTAPDPLLAGVPDRRGDGRPWCSESRYGTWGETWSWTGLQEVLATTLPAYLDYMSQPARAAWAADAFTPRQPGANGRAPGELRDLAVAQRTAEGRVAVLEITTAAGRYRVRGDQTRRVLRPVSGRPAMLRSAWFELTVAPGRDVRASGRGWGHGLGLCQMGALARARAGQDAAAILAHYYPGAILAPLAGEALP